MPEAKPVFRGSMPTPLAFGTSGLRGLVTDITDLEAYVNCVGFLEFLLETLPNIRRSLALGGDLRPSTDSEQRSIMRAVAAACRASGFEVKHCGKLPTPALSYFAFEQQIPSIMVTGSHIPFDRNGIKFNLPEREVLKNDEAEILRKVAEVRTREYAKLPAESVFDDQGMFRPGNCPELPSADSVALEHYRARYLDFFPERPLAGLSIAVYQHSAVGRDFLVELLKALGADVHAVGRSEEFVAIDTEAISDEQLKQLQKLVSELSARVGKVDALVSTDGDSDRPLVLGVDAQKQVRFISGDLLGILVADYLDIDAVAVPVSATDAIDQYFEARAEVRRTRIGSPWVISAMDQLTGKRRAGWEANGGFLLGSAVVRAGRTLRPLATRDAVLPIVCALHRARLRKQALADQLDDLPARTSLAGLIDVPEPAGATLNACFVPQDRSMREVLFEDSALFVLDETENRRQANTSETAELLALRERLAAQLSHARGFTRIERINFTDGVRCYFEGGDVAHVRASGNAPQVRLYAVSNDAARARRIIRDAVAPAGTLEALLSDANEWSFIAAIQRNIQHTEWLFREGNPAYLIGAVSGSAAAQAFWQRSLDALKPSLRAQVALSLHEDLPTNQAFGLLLMWQRLREHVPVNQGALMAFVFGEGSRATPFTETDSAQKPAIASFVRAHGAAGFQSMVGLAMRCFAPVEAFLRRSGFDGVLVKWGDEVQIPARDLSGADALFESADIVRFVSMRTISEDDARSKDWVGVDACGTVTAFIPRRPLAQMQTLAERGLLQRRGASLLGGINLGSIAVSRKLLDELLTEFATEVNDPTADRKQRPDLDPQFFTMLIIALIDNDAQRRQTYSQSIEEVPALAKLASGFPELLPRLRRVVTRFTAKHGRKPKVVAMDFGDQYWGDIGQHRQIYEFYMALNRRTKEGAIARALAGLSMQRDARNNLISADSAIAEGVRVHNSVLIDCQLTGAGTVESSVLIGTRAHDIRMVDAFDVLSCVSELESHARGGTYKVVSQASVVVQAGERVTTLFLPDGRHPLFSVHEDLDLRDRASNYEKPVLGNPLSFSEAHALMGTLAAEVVTERRRELCERVLADVQAKTRKAPPDE